MNMGRFKVSTRLVSGFALVSLMMFAVIALSLRHMSLMQSRTNEITNVNNVEVGLVSSMYLSTVERALAARNILLVSAPSQLEAEYARFPAQAKRYAEADEKLARLLMTDPDAKEKLVLFERIREQARRTEPVLERVLALGQQRKVDAALTVLMDELRPLQREWWTLLNQMSELEAQASQHAVSEAEEAYVSARSSMIIFGCIAAIVGGLASWAITHSLIEELGGEPRVAVMVAERIAAGDLSIEPYVDQGDNASLMNAIKKMRYGLAGIVSQVRLSANSIAAASGQIASGNMDLSSRTEQQAGSLEETASAMEELTSVVRKNAEDGRHARELATVASVAAEKGQIVVDQVIERMNRINSMSSKISDIIGVIDGIAFQTNILALNAAVEAARAGEQGRGFAVVATEVRTLAQRAALAAKEIKTLIVDSVSEARGGCKQVNEAGDAMQEITSCIRRVAQIMADIAGATEQQATGIELINEAIKQIDNVTQQNAALVEEAAAAATSLTGQAAELTKLVCTFHLGANDGGGRQR
ncbi:methyl-accepting chemotaxis protein [Duganella callida]|uniref:Methyl-accepting chemotaxis protein n=1 Tax=Duganella callida TaxID=2561932 RepID=A0A4Y9S9Z9_9BURK|nr:methyl-accepting chemotaxis protein [Duganella callida]TFW18653.1 methyl-accepting chemotaxis protein [Duganella callida]